MRSPAPPKLWASPVSGAAETRYGACLPLIEVEQSVVIGRPPAEVLDILADLENWSRWQPDLLESEQTFSGPMDVGTTFRQAIELGGQRIELYCEVTGYE